MREPPRIADATLIAALARHYGLEISELTFLPIGADSASAVYRAVAADGARYFLKLRTGAGFSPPSLAIPHYLHSQGMPLIAAPLATNSGALWVDLGDFAASLYSLLEARTGTDAGLSAAQWRSLGAATRQIHEQQLPPDLLGLIGRERYIPSRRDVITRLEPLIGAQPWPDPAQAELDEFWWQRRDEIEQIVARADALGAELRAASPPLALCHADLHTWNVLVDGAGQLWIVDWDETILAPKERDLMFVIGGIGRGLVSPQETESFLRGYGEAAIDQRALAYYRYAWAAQEIGAYAEEVFFSPDLSAAARHDAVRSFIIQFEPGNIVDIARSSDLPV